MDTKPSLELMHLNIHSIITDTKQLLLKNLILKHNPDIISLNETFLKPSDIFEIEGYKIIRDDRLNRPGGGSALCIKSNLNYKEISTPHLNKNDYVCGLTINANNNPITIFSIYSPPKEPFNLPLFNQIIRDHKNFIIMGDLNAHNKLWHCKKDNVYGRLLESFTNEHNTQIINNKSITYPAGKSILDLTLLSKSLLSHPHTFKVLNDRISDHLPTLTSIKGMKLKREKITFQKTNWDLFTRTLKSSPEASNTPITSRADLDQTAHILITKILRAAETSTTTITLANKPKSILSIPAALLKQIKLKRKIKRKMLKFHSEELRKMYNMLSRKIKAAISLLKANNLHSNFKALEEFKGSVAKHWKLLKNFDNPPKQNTKKTHFKLDGKIIDQDKEIAENFALYLNSIFSQPTPVHIDQDPPDILPQSTQLPTTSPDPPITLAETTTALASCKTSGAPGIDDTTYKMLKLCPSNIMTTLTHLFDASRKLGIMPSNWKISKVIMIHKENKPKEDFSSYRPISLISCISKLLEKIMNNRLQNWAEKNDILPPCQSGFRKNKSCQDHIARFNQFITEGFNKKQHTGCVMFDLEKAFDKASHQGIIHKLKQTNLPSGLLNWIQDFLTDRSFHTSWNSATSNTYFTRTGVPQGSCISATLFNIFFSDISQHIPEHILRALYADDLGILFRSSDLKEITRNLQIAIDAISAYCHKWGFSINKSKTTYTTFCTAGKRKNYERTYKLDLHIGNSPIPLEPFPIFLGIKLDPKLTYEAHFDRISTKIIARTRLIRKIKSLKLKNQTALCMTIFNSQIKSIIDYAFIPIISPTQKIANKLQTLQNRALRSIKHFPLKTSTKQLNDFFKTDLVSTRAAKIAKKFASSRLSHPQLRADYTQFAATRTPPKYARFKTIFDTFRELI